MPIKFVSFCPCGSECSKGGRRLGAHNSREEAVNKAVWHLTQSSHHSMDEASARDLAELAEYEEEEHEESAEAAKGKAKGKNQSWGSSWGGSSSWRTGPYNWEPQQQQQVVAVQPAPVPQDFLGSVMKCLCRSESAARTAARVARSAALAFDEEAGVMQMSIRTLQDVINQQSGTESR